MQTIANTSLQNLSSRGMDRDFARFGFQNVRINLEKGATLSEVPVTRLIAQKMAVFGLALEGDYFAKMIQDGV